MHFQWYPGHMTKAKRAMQEDIKLIDVIIELVDARIPRSSKNPDIDSLAQGKSRILLLNKSDMADAAKTQLHGFHIMRKWALALTVNSKRNELKTGECVSAESLKRKLSAIANEALKSSGSCYDCWYPEC